jgi:hypothetical protein
MVRAKESTLKVTANVSYPVTSGFVTAEWPEKNLLTEQERHLVRVEGDFTSGDALADAVFAKMPDPKEWNHLLVTIQLEREGEVSRKKDSTGAATIRSFIRLEFDGLRQRFV